MCGDTPPEETRVSEVLVGSKEESCTTPRECGPHERSLFGSRECGPHKRSLFESKA